MKDELLVSVVMITYMHEKYISKAIEGVLMQQTNFEFDLIIADDCSPDQTEAIVKNIIKIHPRGHIIKYFRHASNIGMQRNGSFALNEGKGNYIALCEGDDYWTDVRKLQIQIDFMEINTDFSMSFHSVHVQNEMGDTNYLYPVPRKNVLKFKDILFTHYIPTCSWVFRKNLLPSVLPPWYNDLKMGDMALQLLLADRGMTKYIDIKMSIYRINPTSITQKEAQIRSGRKAYIYLFKSLRNHFGFKYYLIISIMIIKHQLGVIKDLFGWQAFLNRNK